MATPVISRDSAEAGVRLSTLSPKYLHTNSTSHTWPFSAVAELIDNAYDPDVNASQLWIDVKKYNKYNYCLVFTDNGAGMGPEKLHKMLSFGFCDKVAKKGHMPVGHYGNGFKSGSMRLGKDAIVFTKNDTTKSVGFLSQTYLEAIKAETILVPMVTWDSDGKIIEKSDKDKALQDVLKYSMFKFKEELLAEFAGIQNPSGTRIIIFNVRTSPDGKPEFDYSSPDDVRVPEDTDSEISKLRKQERQNHIPESDYSLRAYCAILYLRPRMQIILRGKKVRTSVITKSLSKTEVDYYRPTFREANSQFQGAQNKPVKITFGFSQNKNHYGIMMYHRNRLVKPYVRVGYQLRANNQGVGVVGVIECDFLQPTHNKQDFDYTKAYRACMSALGSKLNDYWNEKKGVQRVNSKDPIPEPVEVLQLPDQIWVQCDNPDCLKWRKMPDGTDPDKLPDKWYCKDHPDINYRSCDVPEEKEEENEQPYVKTQKKRLEKELEDRKRREKEAQVRQAEEAKRLEQQRKELEKKEEELQRLRKTLTQVRNESTIIQSIEENSARQQRAIQQQLKGEQRSPQPLQVKFVPQPSGIKRASQGNLVTSSPQKTPVVLTPNRHQGQPSSIKVVKVISPATAIKSTTGTKPMVHIVPSSQGSIQTKGGQLLPNVVSVTSIQQGQALHLSQGQTVTSSQPAPSIQVKQSPIGGTVQIQRLVLPSGQKVQLQTPISQASPAGQKIQAQYTANKVPIRPNLQQQPQTVQVKVTGTVLPTTVVGQTPNIASTLTSPVLPAGYKPLESLQEVNRQATQAAVVSPVSAVIPEAGDPIPGTPTELRNQVTVSERYRYIAPSPQQTSTAVKSPTSSAAAAAAAAAIAAAAATVSDSPRLQTNQTVKLANSSPTQLQVVATPQSMQVQLKQEPKPAVPVSPLSTTSPSPSGASPSVQISQVHSGVPAVAAASAPVLPVKVKVEKEDSLQVNGVKRKLEDNDVVVEQPPTRKPRRDKEVIVIDSPSPTGDEEKYELSAESEAALQDIDDDLILKLGKLSREDQWVTMAKSAQQLRNLRSNVCKLLRVLVPEIELGDKAEILDDATVDDLLKQVLEANLQPETSET